MPLTEQQISDEADLLKRQDDLRMEVADIFAELRMESRWTQKQAAEHTGMSQQNIPTLEKGRRDLKLGTLQKYAHAYGYAIEVSFVPLNPEED